MSPAPPRILLTNDDGITSPGLHALYDELARIGDVTVVAPDAERSAIGHAITTFTPLRVKEYWRGRTLMGYASSGTPADCVKLGVGTLFDRRPDLVVSGINLGSNTATNVIYSGTVSAATEARILGIPSIAVSLATVTDPQWAYAATIGRRVAAQVLERGLPPKVLLNVNVPNLPRAEIRGIRVTRQGDSLYEEGYELRRDPRGQPYYWLVGTYRLSDEDEETDAWALANGYVSVTPITFDLTAHEQREALAAWRLRA
ncbi:MAG TPA: 5'/3'-nucleotidase SurE [Terriglobales bacterium]|nr:5'/3'-nucleotidase SurE [Terriglobales bacterium]